MSLSVIKSGMKLSMMDQNFSNPSPSTEMSDLQNKPSKAGFQSYGTTSNISSKSSKLCLLVFWRTRLITVRVPTPILFSFFRAWRCFATWKFGEPFLLQIKLIQCYAWDCMSGITILYMMDKFSHKKVSKYIWRNINSHASCGGL